jgi:hypothetical protein
MKIFPDGVDGAQTIGEDRPGRQFLNVAWDLKPDEVAMFRQIFTDGRSLPDVGNRQNVTVATFDASRSWNTFFRPRVKAWGRRGRRSITSRLPRPPAFWRIARGYRCSLDALCFRVFFVPSKRRNPCVSIGSLPCLR